MPCLQASKPTYKELELQCRNLEAELAAVSSDRDNKAAEVEDQRAACQLYHDEWAKGQEEFKTLENEKAQLVAECDNLVKSTAAAAATQASLKQKLQKQKECITRYEDRNAELSQKCDELKKQLDEQDEYIISVENERDELWAKANVEPGTPPPDNVDVEDHDGEQQQCPSDFFRTLQNKDAAGGSGTSASKTAGAEVQPVEVVRELQEKLAKAEKDAAKWHAGCLNWKECAEAGRREKADVQKKLDELKEKRDVDLSGILSDFKQHEQDRDVQWQGLCAHLQKQAQQKEQYRYKLQELYYQNDALKKVLEQISSSDIKQGLHQESESGARLPHETSQDVVAGVGAAQELHAAPPRRPSYNSSGSKSSVPPDNGLPAAADAGAFLAGRGRHRGEEYYDEHNDREDHAWTTGRNNQHNMLTQQPLTGNSKATSSSTPSSNLSRSGKKGPPVLPSGLPPALPQYNFYNDAGTSKVGEGSRAGSSKTSFSSAGRPGGEERNQNYQNGAATVDTSDVAIHLLDRSAEQAGRPEVGSFTGGAGRFLPRQKEDQDNGPVVDASSTSSTFDLGNNRNPTRASSSRAGLTSLPAPPPLGSSLHHVNGHVDDQQQQQHASTISITDSLVSELKLIDEEYGRVTRRNRNLQQHPVPPDERLETTSQITDTGPKGLSADNSGIDGAGSLLNTSGAGKIKFWRPFSSSKTTTTPTT
ncbi:unnamed protein product [Amoebophrya sp. A120]|nr:unnamed protein product [Amoebophrya sp. A120]|eukprot:GSA120T00024364001.1